MILSSLKTIENSKLSITIAIFIALIIFVLQVLPLFWSVPFAWDWFNHVWGVSYYAEYFKLNFSFPSFYDFNHTIGDPSPSFYGVFFYPLISLVSIFSGPENAIRIMAFLFLLIPTFSYYFLFNLITKKHVYAIFLAVVVNVSIYQLTNLYSRSALTEFFAYQGILISLSLIFYGVLKGTKIGYSLIFIGFSFLAFSLGSHPITFYSFFIFGSGIIIASLPFMYKSFGFQRSALLVVLSIMIILLLSPWIFNVLEFRNDLLISQSSKGLIFYPNSLDSLLARLGIIFTDIRVEAQSIKNVSTPYLDAPFSIPLTIILIATCCYLTITRKMYFFSILFLCFFILMIYISIVPYFTNEIGDELMETLFLTSKDSLIYKVLTPIQMYYRLAGTYSIVAILFLIMCLLQRFHFKRENFFKYEVLILILCVFLSILSVGVKFHSTYKQFYEYPKMTLGVDNFIAGNQDYKAWFNDVGSFPKTYYGANAFIMKDIYPASRLSDSSVKEIIKLNILSRKKEYHFFCVRDCIIKTNILPTKYVQVYLDGELSNAISINDARLELSAGVGEHSILIDTDTSILDFILLSVYLFLCIFFLSVFYFFILIIRLFFSSFLKSKKQF